MNPLLIDYLKLLQKWNKAYNLTSIDEWDQMVTHHLMDSLSIAPYLKGPRILDVGTGAGLPGIPLAVQCPQYQFFLLESRQKKVIFLRQVMSALKLTNVEIIHQRAEDYDSSEKFHTIVTRAVGSLKEVLSMTKHLLAKDGLFLAMKGHYPTEELAEIKQPAEVIPLQIPGITESRHLVKIYG